MAKKLISWPSSIEFAVRLIVEPEEEIEQFIKQEYWTIIAEFMAKNGQFAGQLVKWQGKSLDKFAIIDEKTAQQIKQELLKSSYKIDKIHKERTSKNQQRLLLLPHYSKRLGFSAKQTMVLAQNYMKVLI